MNHHFKNLMVTIVDYELKLLTYLQPGKHLRAKLQECA